MQVSTQKESNPTSQMRLSRKEPQVSSRWVLVRISAASLAFSQARSLGESHRASSGVSGSRTKKHHT